MKLKVKVLLMFCSLLLALPAIASVERSSKQDASARGGATAGETPAVPVNEVSDHSIQVQATRKTGRKDLTRVQIREAEQRLSTMGYWTGAVDGRFDAATRSALIAFQKWEGRPVTGKLTSDELDAIRKSADPAAREDSTITPAATSLVEKEAWPKPKEAGYAHVEVDLDRQVLLIVNDKDAVRVLPVSTGSGKPFIDERQESIAYTPRGRFVVYDKTIGWEKGEFSAMYYSNYISGGVAIHGYHSVPAQPESHGCIRIPLFAAREVSRLMPLGTIVLLYDKVSFVSGRLWAENPELRQAAVLNSAYRVYEYQSAGTKTSQRQETKAKPKSLVTKKARGKSFRAGS